MKSIEDFLEHDKLPSGYEEYEITAFGRLSHLCVFCDDTHRKHALINTSTNQFVAAFEEHDCTYVGVCIDCTEEIKIHLRDEVLADQYISDKIKKFVTDGMYIPELEEFTYGKKSFGICPFSGEKGTVRMNIPQGLLPIILGDYKVSSEVYQEIISTDGLYKYVFTDVCRHTHNKYFITEEEFQARSRFGSLNNHYSDQVLCEHYDASGRMRFDSYICDKCNKELIIDISLDPVFLDPLFVNSNEAVICDCTQRIVFKDLDIYIKVRKVEALYEVQVYRYSSKSKLEEYVSSDITEAIYGNLFKYEPSK